MQPLRGMDTPRRYRIVAALDGSQYSEIVLEHALDQAARHDAPDLHLITVVEAASDVEFTKRWLARMALEGLDDFRDRREGWRTRLHVRVGKADEEIANLAAEVAADLLVIGNYGVHPQRKPIAARVLERASCATLVVGLTGHPVEAEPQCPDCVAIREASEGERWFCDAHTGDHPMHASLLVPRGLPLVHGGPLW